MVALGIDHNQSLGPMRCHDQTAAFCFRVFATTTLAERSDHIWTSSVLLSLTYPVENCHVSEQCTGKKSINTGQWKNAIKRRRSRETKRGSAYSCGFGSHSWRSRSMNARIVIGGTPVMEYRARFGQAGIDLCNRRWNTTNDDEWLTFSLPLEVIFQFPEDLSV